MFRMHINVSRGDQPAAAIRMMANGVSVSYQTREAALAATSNFLELAALALTGCESSTCWGHITVIDESTITIMWCAVIVPCTSPKFAQVSHLSQ